VASRHWQDPSADEISQLTQELARSAELVREQAASIAHYRKMYDRASALAKIGVWEFDLVTETMTWTDSVYDLFELPRGTPLSRARILEYYGDESRREMERLRAEAIRTGGSFGLDIHIHTALGNPRWLHLTVDVEQEDGRAVRIFGTKQDVTEAREAQDQVRALQAELIHVSRRSAMGAMAATVAHELNQPLAAIANYAVGARRALAGGEPAAGLAADGLEAIERNAIRAGQIIRSLRQIVDGSMVRRQRLQADDLFRESAALALAGEPSGLSVDYQFDTALSLYVDPVQFQQVLINLIRNAGEAVRSGERREIAIIASLVPGGAEIRIEDSGPGVAPDILPQVFDAFVSTKPEGMGVGLAISRTIVEAHGGRISASNRESGGASFRILLPPAAGESVPERPASAPKSAKLRAEIPHPRA
jgi:two-component system sensor kinase FixL